jgi:2-hydroxychromene-2-carboxylate isomerase
MMQPIFYFDFGSPNAYLSHRVIPDIEAWTGVTFEYRPTLLGGLFKLTGNQSPMQAFGGIKNKLAYEALETQRFIKRHGLTAFKMNPHFPVNTLKMMRGALAAQSLGVLAPYVEAMYRAMWEDGRKMDDPEEIAAVVTAAGLDTASILARSEEPAIKQALIDNTQAACDAGAFGIPTFAVNGELWFGKDRLRDVEEAIVGSQSGAR